MFKYLVTVVSSLIISNEVVSQILVNEVIFDNDSTLDLELFNKSSDTLYLESIYFRVDSIEITRQLTDFRLEPKELSVITLTTGRRISELKKIYVVISSGGIEYTANYNGWILKGESIGRCPDFTGDFIVYKQTQVTPGSGNFIPGILVKKSSKTQFSPRDSSPNAALYYDGKYWIFGGYIYDEESGTYYSKANIWNSPDGLEWTMVIDNPPFTQYSGFVVFDNKMMVFKEDTVLISEDGLQWDKYECNALTYENYRFVVFKNRIFAVCSDMTYESADGIIWTGQRNDFPKPDLRSLPALVSSGDKLWLYGGGGIYNDVWNSEDGVHWVKIIDHAPWSPRIWFNYTYFDHKMWMIEGRDESQTYSDTLNFGNMKDFWYSPDGLNWTQLKTDDTYQNRHASFLWNDGNRILISSGFGNNFLNRLYNDVWEIDPPVSPMTRESISTTLCLNTPMNGITFSIRGGDGAVVTGLPPGVEGKYKDGLLTITGAPEESGTFSYNINVLGPYGLPSVNGMITVYPEASVSLISQVKSDDQFLYSNTQLKTITYAFAGADSAIVTGLPPGIEYSVWSGTVIINGSPEEAGNYYYRVNTEGKCESALTSGNITVNDIMIFPNPTTGVVNILNNGPFTLSIYDITGKIVFNKYYGESYPYLNKDFSNILRPDQVYIFAVRNNNNRETITQKVMVTR